MMFIAVGFAYGQDFTGTINSYLNSNQSELGLQSQDFEDIIGDRHSYSKSMDLDNVYVIQRHQGIEIFNSTSSFAIKEGAVTEPAIVVFPLKRTVIALDLALLAVPIPIMKALFVELKVVGSAPPAEFQTPMAVDP